MLSKYNRYTYLVLIVNLSLLGACTSGSEDSEAGVGVGQEDIFLPVAPVQTLNTSQERSTVEVTLFDDAGLPYTVSAPTVAQKVVGVWDIGENSYSEYVGQNAWDEVYVCLLYTSPSPRDRG